MTVATMSSDNPIETEEYLGCTIEVYYDTDSENPLDFDRDFKIVMGRSRSYELSGVDEVVDTDSDYFDGWAEHLWERHRSHRFAYIMPIQFQDYGSNGCRVLTQPITGLGELSSASEWMNGYAYSDSPLALGETAQRLKEQIKVSIQEWEDWLNGNVYGYIARGPNGGDHVDSCWGFYGDGGKEYMLTEARSAIDNYLESHPDSVRLVGDADRNTDALHKHFATTCPKCKSQTFMCIDIRGDLVLYYADTENNNRNVRCPACGALTRITEYPIEEEE